MKLADIILVSDFETETTDHPETQDYTNVWSAASSICFTADEGVAIQTTMNDYWTYLQSFYTNLTVYFHNLRFDGTFILCFLLSKGYRYHHVKKPQKELNVGEFDCVISSRNKWYTATVRTSKRQIIEIRDSLKLLPFSLKRIGDSFKLKHRKLEMEYTGHKAGEPIREEDRPYIENDCLVLREAMEYMIRAGNVRLTIGSNVLDKIKRTVQVGTLNVDEIFPDLKAYKIDPEIYGYENADAYVRSSFRGGWCYLHEEYANQKLTGTGLRPIGITADKNSMYPSHMHSTSEEVLPYGAPYFFKHELPEDVIRLPHCYYYFLRVRCRFKLKVDHLPTIQIKRSPLYRATEWLKTSDIKYHGKYYRYYPSDDTGGIEEAKPTLTLSQTDWILFQEHYDIYNLEILDYCVFSATSGIFDIYINEYMKIKEETTGAQREEAKLYLNNGYGKIASSDDSSYLEPYLDEGVLKYITHLEHERKTVHIGCGAAITSLSRNDVIRSAQKNYKYFIYADTDSLHMLWDPEHDYGLKIDEKKLNHWKIESYWSSAIFIRQKTYAEFIIMNHKKEQIKDKRWEIKCAGMTETAKQLFLSTRPIQNFTYGLHLPKCRLKPKNIKGGQVLFLDDYTMRKEGSFSAKGIDNVKIKML